MVLIRSQIPFVSVQEWNRRLASIQTTYLRIKHSLWTTCSIPQQAKLTPSCEEIISHLLQENPSTVIAGGYASYVSHLKSSYNDIDVFIPVDPGCNTKTVYNNIKSSITKLAIDKKFLISFSAMNRISYPLRKSDNISQFKVWCPPQRQPLQLVLVGNRIPDFVDESLKRTYFSALLLNNFDYDFCKIGLANIDFKKCSCWAFSVGLSSRMTDPLLRSKRLFQMKVNKLLKNKSVQAGRQWPRKDNLIRNGYNQVHKVTKNCKCRDCLVLSAQKCIMWKKLTKDLVRVEKCLNSYIRPAKRNNQCPSLVLMCINVIDKYELSEFLELVEPRLNNRIL